MPTHEHRWRHLALLISILVLFMVSPFVVTFRHGVLILNIIGATVLVAGSYALSESTSSRSLLLYPRSRSSGRCCCWFLGSIGLFSFPIHASSFWSFSFR